MATGIRAAEVGMWLIEKAKARRPIGIDITVTDDNAYAIEFADLLPGDEQVLTGTVGDDGCAMLLAAFSVWADKPSLIAVGLPGAVAALSTLTGISRRAITDRVLGDIMAIEDTLGPLGSEYTAREALRQWRGIETMPMPPYYEAIAKPLQRMRGSLVSDGPGWEVRYSELWLRVVAYFSHDPQLLQALLQDDYPPQDYLTKQLSVLYDGVTQEHAFACILLTVLGGDLVYMKSTYPEYAEMVEELGNTEKLMHNLDKMIPAIHLMAVALSTVPPEGYFSTMYGRRMAYRITAYTAGPGAYLDHTISGTVLDLVHILCVTLMNQGAAVEVPLQLHPLAHSIRVCGTTKERDVLYWIGQLRQLSTLAGPLMPVSLGASVGRIDDA